MSERKLEAVRKEIQALSLEVSELKDRSAELSLREGPGIPQERYDIQTQIKRKEDAVRSLEEVARGLALRIKRLPEMRLKAREMEKRAKELNACGLKVLERLEKHRRKVRQDVNDLREITREFHKLQAQANEIKGKVDAEEMPDVSTKKSFEPPTNSVYFGENKGIVTKW